MKRSCSSLKVEFERCTIFCNFVILIEAYQYNSKDTAQIIFQYKCYAFASILMLSN